MTTTSKFILPGSIENDGHTVRAAVFVGTSEWDVDHATLRYVEGRIDDGLPDDTVESFLFRIYDNSTGCLLKGGFEAGRDRA